MMIFSDDVFGISYNCTIHKFIVIGIYRNKIEMVIWCYE